MKYNILDIMFGIFIYEDNSAKYWSKAMDFSDSLPSVNF